MSETRELLVTEKDWDLAEEEKASGFSPFECCPMFQAYCRQYSAKNVKVSVHWLDVPIKDSAKDTRWNFDKEGEKVVNVFDDEFEGNKAGVTFPIKVLLTKE